MGKKTNIKWRNLLLFLVAAIGLIALAQFFVRPNMVGWDIDRVLIYESGNDIRIRYAYRFTEADDYGIILEQENCPAAEECDISLVVSTGRDVSLMPEAQIRAYLMDLVAAGKLSAAQIREPESVFDDEVEAGFAILYDPRPSEGVIEVVFSRGPEIFIDRATIIAAGDIRIRPYSFGLEAILSPFQPLLFAADISFASDTFNLGGFNPEDALTDPLEDGEGSAVAETEGDAEGEGSASYNQLPHAVVGAGFNLIARAGSHVFDGGLEALEKASSSWGQLSIQSAGVNDSPEQQQEIPVTVADGLKVASLAFTSSMNTSLPSGQSFLVNRFSYSLALQLIEQARETADVVLVFMDWGDDSQRVMRERAQWLADQGVQIIIGNRPEILPVGFLEGEGGNQALVAYSLGQFVGEPGSTGLLLGFNLRRVTVRQETTLHFDNVRLMPTISVLDASGFLKALPLAEYDGEGANFESMVEEWKASGAEGILVESLN
ncbi:MAG: CapA family protein [Turicibacter sp.]|nr:CapA family protein [Turicibacter sp.]